LARLRAEGKAVVRDEQAREQERRFLQGFAEAFEQIETLPDPLSGIDIHLADARVKHRLAAEAPDESRGPTNAASRFVLRTGGWGKPKAALAVEAGFVSRLGVLKAQGYDAEPATAAELVTRLQAGLDQAERDGMFTVMVLASPTGWSDEAREVLTGSAWRGRMSSGHLAVALHDLHSGQQIVDEADDRLGPLWPVLAADRWRAKVAEAERRALAEVSRSGMVSASDLSGQVGRGPWSRAALRRLADSGDFSLRELSDGDWVLSRG
jgi:hypothetical protein